MLIGSFQSQQHGERNRPIRAEGFAEINVIK